MPPPPSLVRSRPTIAHNTTAHNDRQRKKWRYLLRFKLLITINEATQKNIFHRYYLGRSHDHAVSLGDQVVARPCARSNRRSKTRILIPPKNVLITSYTPEYEYTMPDAFGNALALAAGGELAKLMNMVRGQPLPQPLSSRKRGAL